MKDKNTEECLASLRMVLICVSLYILLQLSPILAWGLFSFPLKILYIIGL